MGCIWPMPLSELRFSVKQVLPWCCQQPQRKERLWKEPPAGHCWIPDPLRPRGSACGFSHCVWGSVVTQHWEKGTDTVQLPGPWPPSPPSLLLPQLPLATLAPFLTSALGTSNVASNPLLRGALCQAECTRICAGLSLFPPAGVLNVLSASPCHTPRLVELGT